MGVELTDRDRSRIIDSTKRGALPLVPDGPFLATFDARAVAAALIQEAERARVVFGSSAKVDLRMDAADAVTLAHLLLDSVRR